MPSERVIRLWVWEEPRECGHVWHVFDGKERIEHLRARRQAVAWGKESALSNLDAYEIPDVIRFEIIDGKPDGGT
jgi:hypothetical protein